MTWTNFRRMGAAALMLFTAGCGLLDVSDPTAIEDSELENAAGANLLRLAALRDLYLVAADGALLGGLMTDELVSDATPSASGVSQFEALDRRDSDRVEELWAAPGLANQYGSWQKTRTSATTAIAQLSEYAAGSGGREHLGEMFAVRGFVSLRLAEDFCPGLPLHDLDGYDPVYGSPLDTDEIFAAAVDDLDSAVVYAADSARILDFARIARGRALLGLGRFDEAAAAVALVPTEYVAEAEFTSSSFLLRSPLDLFTQYARTVSVADLEGGNGLDFVSTDDPRVETTEIATAKDGTTGIYAADKYPTRSAPFVLASGIEARLIEAEAALQANPDDLGWLTILNDLRAADGRPELTPLTDPGTEAARVDLLFRERAFWLFFTGHRLGDLRRLVRHYGRDVESVFPTGPYRLSGTYDAATSMPFTAAGEATANPAITGCTSR